VWQKCRGFEPRIARKEARRYQGVRLSGRARHPPPLRPHRLHIGRYAPHVARTSWAPRTLHGGACAVFPGANPRGSHAPLCAKKPRHPRGPAPALRAYARAPRVPRWHCVFRRSARYQIYIKRWPVHSGTCDWFGGVLWLDTKPWIHIHRIKPPFPRLALSEVGMATRQSAQDFKRLSYES